MENLNSSFFPFFSTRAIADPGGGSLGLNEPPSNGG